MVGLKNLLNLIAENWAIISVVLSLIIFTIIKLKNWKNMSKDEKLDSLLLVIQQWILKMMCEAEKNWEDYNSSGEVKKSEVIAEIYKQFPQLADYSQQDEILTKIETMINGAMASMNKIMNPNEEKNTGNEASKS